MTTTLCFDFYSIYSYCQSPFNHYILPLHFHVFHSTPQSLSLLFMHSLLLIILLYLTSSPHPSTPLSHLLIDIKVGSRKITSPPLTSPLHPSLPLPLLFRSSEKKDHITVAVRPQRSRDLNNVLLPASPAYSQSGSTLYSSI